MWWRRDWAETLEVTDLLLAVDDDGRRLPVAVEEVAAAFEATGDAWGARIVRRLPRQGSHLDPDAVDRLLVAVHGELSRLTSDLGQPFRLRALLRPIVAELREQGHDGPIRVVDVGCGTGFTIRWLTAKGDLPTGVELVGCDLDPALVAEARRLADLDGIACRFEAADAFALDDPATILTSAGVIHHFRDDALRRFFAAHDPTHVQAFVHFDTTPHAPWLRYLGAWLFHLARMRLEISRHDGVVSAMRTHGDAELVAAAAAGAPWADVALLGPAGTGSPFVNVLRPVIGTIPALSAGVRRRLGSPTELRAAESLLEGR
ncbi:MAG: class I SAM-dependent methyltransferase [Acidimicrobiales bacterium]